MKGIVNKLTTWAMRTFFTMHYVHTYKGEKLEYEVVRETVAEKIAVQLRPIEFVEA